MPATPRATRWTGARLDDVPAGRALDDPRLGLVVRLVIIVSLAVVPLDAVLYLATGHPILLAKGLALAALAAWTAWAWPRMSRRNVSSFVGLLSIGIIAVVVVIAQLLPELALGMPAAALIPVVLALPFMAGRPLIRLMAVAWMAMVVVAIVAELGLTASGLPVWAVSVLRVTNAASIGSLSLLLLWQYRSRLLESNRELDTLVGMSRELSTTLDPQRIGHLMAEHLAVATGADACLISSWDRVADRVETFGQYPLEQIPGTSDSYALDEYPETRRVLDDQVVVMVDLADRDADPAETAYLRTIGHRRSAMLPLIAKGETIGLIELSVASDERFYERALRVASTLAAEAAMALENARLYQELRHQAFHDGLTRLANRALFNDRLEHALARGARTGSPLAILFVDLDDFKTVNDRMGHARGDQLLYEVAERLRSCLRTGDTAARLGGDEFCVLLEDLERPLEAEIVARRILDSIAESVRIGGSEVTVDASIGIAVSGGGGSTADELLRNADFAMYRAKSLGKGRAEVFRPGMRVGASERRQLESLLQGAVERSELRLQYQPVVDLESGSLTGFEALVRWQQPGHGMRMPADFISIVEDTGLI
ncbi:MAG TPA: GGDEF and EAL domain-containing protein, partial [Candidatus Limnocylindrales bacterium]|nr:GGDEF and EAL domain-containing protein [Candidatus Limnocylindrales bacterium]